MFSCAYYNTIHNSNDGESTKEYTEGYTKKMWHIHNGILFSPKKNELQLF